MKTIVLFAEDRDEDFPDQLFRLTHAQFEVFQTLLRDENIFVKTVNDPSWMPHGVTKTIDLEDYMDEFIRALSRLDGAVRYELLNLLPRYRFVGFYESIQKHTNQETHHV